MFKNYLKIAWRNLVRHKVYSLINILGLAVGISACLLIVLYVQHELSYEQGFSHQDRLVRVAKSFIVNGEAEKSARTSGALAPTLRADYPEVELTTRILKRRQASAVRQGDTFFNFNHIYFVDSTFFRLFDYPFLAGSPEKSLQAPNSMVLTLATAQKLFGGAPQALGQRLELSGESYSVTGVIAPEGASHLAPDILVSLSSYGADYLKQIDTGWGNNNLYTYLLLRDPAQIAPLQAKLPQFFKDRIEPTLLSWGSNAKMEFALQPLADIHLDNQWLDDLTPSGNKVYLFIFSAVAVFVLLIASINYMNLATARSAKRAKEVGVRKVVGAHRAQLIGQFLGESFFLILLAVLLALALVELLLPSFNRITEQNIPATYFADSTFLLLLLGLVLFLGLVAGSYPAFFLSSFKPTQILKANTTPKGSAATLRKGLVILQFTISLFMLIGTMTVYSQMDFLKNADLGFDQEQVLALDIPNDAGPLMKQLPLIKTELLRNPGVTYVSVTENLPGQETNEIIFSAEQEGRMVEKSMNMVAVDYDYLRLMGIPLKAGRNFSPETPSDLEDGLIINEAAAESMGWTNPVGKKLGFTDPTNVRVIGVVKDFHYTSLHNDVAPLVLQLKPRSSGYLLVKMAGGTLPGTMAFVKDTWKRFDPNHPLEYTLLDDSFNAQYQAEDKMLVIFGYFSLLTIAIACMGLFGLTSYMAEQRTKEIGIRKVLGSTVAGIVLLLSKDFAVLVLIAILLACPLAWFGMQQWLQEFAYRVPMSPWLYVGAGATAFVIALTTVGVQAAKAALLNPVKALRSE